MPPSASSNRPTLSRTAPVNAPFDVAEQFAFEQARGQGGAVDLDERPARPWAVVVDRLGQQSLAGAALAADQHGRRAGGHLSSQAQQLPQGRAAADDAAGQRFDRTLRPASARDRRGEPGLGRQLLLQGQDAPLLLGDLLDLGLQFAVERFDRPMAFGTGQREGRERGERGQQVEVFAGETAAAGLGTEDQHCPQDVFVGQATATAPPRARSWTRASNGPGPTRGGIVSNVPSAATSGPSAGNCSAGGTGPMPPATRKASVRLPQIDGPAWHAEQVAGGPQQPPGQRRRIDELFDRLAEQVQRLVELRFVAAIAAVERPPQPGSGEIQSGGHHQGDAGDPECLLDKLAADSPARPSPARRRRRAE